MNNFLPPVCSVNRNEETFRRFFALMSWFLKIFTMIVFFATIRLRNQQVQVEEEHSEPELLESNNHRHRRVAYRHLNKEGNSSFTPND